MPEKMNHVQTAFNAGEFSPKMLARSDHDKYQFAASTMQNMVPSVQGTIEKRVGSRYVATTKNNALPSVLIPFVDTNGTAYMIEVGHQYMRFFKEDGEVVGAPFELVSPFADFWLYSLQYVQSGDVMYFSSSGYAPRTLTKNSSSDTDWTIAEMVFDWPPFKDENTDTSAEFYVSAFEGTGVTLTAVGHTPFSLAMGTAGIHIKFRDSAAGQGYVDWAASTAVTSGDIRRYEGNVYRSGTTGTTGDFPPTHTFGTVSDGVVDWEYLHSGEGYAKIVGYTSSTVVTIDILSPLPTYMVGSGNETPRWSWSSWGDTTGFGFPAAIAIHENRLVLGSSTSQPQTIWGSVSDEYANFKAGTTDSDSYQYTIGSDQLNTIRWMNSGKALLLGTDFGEFSVSGTRIYEAITPTNIRVVRETNFGSLYHRPLRLGDRVFFNEKNSRRLRELSYNFDTQSYQAIDTTVFAEHITDPAFGQGAKQESPTPILWYPRYYYPDLSGDGCLIGITYNAEQNVMGWHKQVLGGSGFVESVGVLKKSTYDQIWLIVRRTINGSTVRYVEYIDPPSVGTGVLEDSHYLDCGIYYNGASTTTITGLGHLEGETVSILADGATQTNKVVSSAQITLDIAASKVHAGYSVETKLSTMPIVPEKVRTGLNARISTVTLRLLSTGEGLFIGPSEGNTKEVPFRKPGDLMDTPVPLYSGIVGPIEFEGDYTRDPSVFIEHTIPLPFELCALITDLVIQDE